jgi:hypothetical protein
LSSVTGKLVDSKKNNMKILNSRNNVRGLYIRDICFTGNNLTISNLLALRVMSQQLNKNKIGVKHFSVPSSFAPSSSVDLTTSPFVTKRSKILQKDSPVFKLLEEFLMTNPSNEDTQIKLEEFLIKQWEFITEYNLSSNNKSLLDYNKITGSVIREIKGSIGDVEKLLNNFRINNSNIKFKKSMKQEDKVSFCL